ncbi:uncharacterized protein LOC141634317 [Silene latifolia]|uniref:uncharacterized protein LOC141634317 n=1 Tax=Silene latifolia TaxID=37657 RepID=UPI003D770C96
MAGNNEIPMPSATLDRESWLKVFMDNMNQFTRLKNDGSNFADWEASLRNAATADGKLRDASLLRVQTRFSPRSLTSSQRHRESLLMSIPVASLMRYSRRANWANYYMNDLKKSPHELHSLLVQTEKDMKLSGSMKQYVLTISNKGKGKGKAHGDLAVGKPKFKKPGNGKSGPGETSGS